MHFWMFHIMLSAQKYLHSIFFFHLQIVFYWAVGEARRDTMLPSILVFVLELQTYIHVSSLSFSTTGGKWHLDISNGDLFLVCFGQIGWLWIVPFPAGLHTMCGFSCVMLDTNGFRSGGLSNVFIGRIQTDNHWTEDLRLLWYICLFLVHSYAIEGLFKCSFSPLLNNQETLQTDCVEYSMARNCWRRGAWKYNAIQQ